MDDRITQILQQKAAAMPSNDPPSMDFSQMYNPALMQSMQQPQASSVEQVKMAAAQGQPQAQQVIKAAAKIVDPRDQQATDALIQHWSDHPENLDPSNSYQMMTTGAQWLRQSGYQPQMPSIQQIGMQDLGNIASGKGTNVLGLTQDAAKIAENGGVNGKLPAAVILANEMQRALASGDTQRYNALLLASKSMDKGITTDANGNPIAMAGYGAAKGQNAYGEKFGATSGVNAADLAQKPAIESAVTSAHNIADTLSKQSLSDAQAMPLLAQLDDFNEKTFDTPYANIAQVPAQFLDSYKDQTTAFDLMQQNRTNLAIPLAKALGVNPTDRDFQATLDSIFNIKSSKTSRRAQIDALRQRISNRQMSNPIKSGIGGSGQQPTVGGGVNFNDLPE